MNAIEQRARELLARMEKAKRKERGHWCDARASVDSGCEILPQLIAAITPPEGFVLVPVESVRQCECGCHRYSCQSCGTELGGHSYEPTRPEVP